MNKFFEISLCLNTFFLLLQTFEYLELKDKIQIFFNNDKVFKFTLILKLIIIFSIPICLFQFQILMPILIFFLILIQLYYFYHFNGPFNGGSDYISTIVLFALFFISLFRDNNLISNAIALYISLQVILSYFLPGVFKLLNSNWNSGKALKMISNTPNFRINKTLLQILNNESISPILTYVIILIEIMFPLLFIAVPLWQLLPILILFHILNFYIFGLNRFIFAWIQAYPFLFWFRNFIILKYNF